MKTAPLAAALIALVLPSPARAWVELKLTIPHKDYLRYQPIAAEVSVKNGSSSDIRLGGATPTASLSLLVEKLPNIPVAQLQERLLADEVAVPPGETRVVKINIVQHYDVYSPGSYKVMAAVELGGQMFVSTKVSFTVDLGLEILSLRTRNLATRAEDGRYRLLYIMRDRSEVVLLVSEDAEGHQSFGVAELGNIIRIRKPVMDVDSSGNAHVLHQSAPQYYTYSVVSSAGKVLNSEMYIPSSGGIRLVKGDDGLIDLYGGELFVPQSEQDAPGPRGPPRIVPP